MMLLVNFKRSIDGMKKNSFAVVLRVALGLVVWFILYKGFAAFIEPLYADKIPEILVYVIRCMVVPYTLGMGGCYLIIRGMDKAEMTGEMVMTPGLLFKAFIVQTGLSMPVIIIINIICTLVGITGHGIGVNEITGSHWLFYLILLLIFNPIFEEILFRKLALDRLMVLGEKTAIIVSAIFFALPHIYSAGVPQFFGTFIIALIYAYLRVKTGRLWPAVILHCLFNFYGCYFAAVMQSMVPTRGIFILLSILIIPIIAVILVVKHFKKNAATGYGYSKGVI